MIWVKKYVDRAGYVAYHFCTDKTQHIIRFTALQYLEQRDRIAMTIRRTRTQLKGVTAGQELSKGEHK